MVRESCFLQHRTEHVAVRTDGRENRVSSWNGLMPARKRLELLFLSCLSWQSLLMEQDMPRRPTAFALPVYKRQLYTEL